MWKQKSTVNERNFNNMVVLIDTEKALLHELNPVGSRIWSLCDGAHPSDEIATILSDEFDVSMQEAKGDLEKFLSRLAQVGLIERAEETV